MGRTIINDELIIEMNELYLKIKTYAGVSRALGGSPAPSTIKKYIIPNFSSRKEIEEKEIKWNWKLVSKVKDINLQFSDFGDLCELSLLEEQEIKNLWEELSL